MKLVHLMPYNAAFANLLAYTSCIQIRLHLVDDSETDSTPEYEMEGSARVEASSSGDEEEEDDIYEETEDEEEDWDIYDEEEISQDLKLD
jgi:hypothetical protein